MMYLPKVDNIKFNLDLSPQAWSHVPLKLKDNARLITFSICFAVMTVMPHGAKLRRLMQE